MNGKILEYLGLTGNEIKVYLALLRLGSVPAGVLIKESKMHRAAVYDLIEMLIEKGLVSFVIKANRKYFEAQEPGRLLELVEAKKMELDEREGELKVFISELKNVRKISKEEQEGSVYKGKKGLKSIFEDILNERKPWFVFGATGRFKEIFNAYFIHFHAKRAKLKISLKIIFSEDLKSQSREKELKFSDIKYIPKNYLTPSTTFIYGDKVAIINWSDEPMAFLMRSKSVANSYRTFFELLWGIAKR